MVQTITLPKLGQTVEEATIVKWHAKTGEKVKKGDILFEIETDKAVLEVESFFNGTLLKILVQDGETVPVMSTVAFVGEPGDPIPEVIPSKQTKSITSKAAQPQTSASSAARGKIQEHVPDAAARTPSALADSSSSAQRRKPISPRARRLARECAINAELIPGSGPEGRVVENDVRQYLSEHDYDSIRITPTAKALATKENVDILSIDSKGERITVSAIKQGVAEKPKPMEKLRSIIAERLTHSFTTTPHFFVTTSVDMTDLIALRKAIKKQAKPYSVTTFILKATALALKKFPALNSVTDGKTIRWHSRVHIGMATAIKKGLVVPVIRDAHEISLSELHAIAQTLAIKARDEKLQPDEMTGSTFTVSNMGMLNVENFTAIINPGESAILAISSIIEKPVVIKGRVEVRSMMKMTLSSDHRIIDGSMAADFINAVKNLIEDTKLWKNLI